MNTGYCAVLSIGAGDISLSFDSNNPSELAESQQFVEDMLKKGYTIMVKVAEDEEGDPLYKVAVSFDKERNEYLVIGAPDERKKEKKPKRVKADTAEAVAAAPVAKGCAPGPFRG